MVTSFWRLSAAGPFRQPGAVTNGDPDKVGQIRHHSGGPAARVLKCPAHSATTPIIRPELNPCDTLPRVASGQVRMVCQ